MDTEFYTAEEAMKVLNKPRSTFFKEVGEGKIPSVLEPGKKRGRRFPKEAIDLHAKREKEKQRSMLGTRFSFDQATNSDMWVAAENAKKTYGEDDYIPYAKYLEWRDINDKITMVMHEDNIYAGHVTIIPTDDKGVIHALLHDNMREQQIPTRAIKKWADRQLLAYIAGVTIASTGDKAKDARRGRYLIAHTMRWTIALYHQYDIKSFYAIGATEEGQKILEHIGFTEIVSLYTGTRKGYVLDDIKKVSQLTHAFMEAVEKEEMENTNGFLPSPDK